MASPRQIRANQLNAQKSTGPKTAEGKARSCQNAFKHGLAGTGPVCNDFVAARVEERKELFRELYPTRNGGEEWLYEEMCTAAVLLDNCRSEQTTLMVEQVARAHDFWDLDRMAEARDLAKGIQKNPDVVVGRLTQSCHGCLWLRERWEFLLREWNEGRWGPGQHVLAHELLGTPKTCREGTPWGDNPAAFLQARAAYYGETAERYREIEEFTREAAMQGLALDVSRKMSLMRRYEQQLLRRFHTARRALLKADREASTPAPPGGHWTPPETESDAPVRPGKRHFDHIFDEPVQPLSLKGFEILSRQPNETKVGLSGSIESPLPTPEEEQNARRLKDHERAARRKREKQARKRQRRS
ncbi:MAG: hypothetical protein U0794_00685 [Isosphaeraceae bacterium]